jgi:hypothetical protein
LITNENLQKLVAENKVDDYLDFFRSNYIQRPTTAASSNATPLQTAAETQQNVTPVEVAEEPKTKEYSGPYNEDISGEHYFVFVIPRLDIDQPAFISGINQFNQANYANLSLKVEVQPLDDIRQIVLITGLPNKEAAMPYFTKVVNNRDLYLPLRNGNYRNFLATKSNFEVFIQEKNIIDYMDFYKRVYLGQ